MIFGGIDPGQKGGLAFVDDQAQALWFCRWSRSRPKYLFDLLSDYRPQVATVYLEAARVFSGQDRALITRGQSLYINQGIWEGWLIALGLPYLIVDPGAWESAHDLYRWRHALKSDPGGPTITSKARSRWPQVPYSTQPDDGLAAALLLADLARWDAARGLDRAALQEDAARKKKVQKARLRAIKKGALEARAFWEFTH